MTGRMLASLGGTTTPPQTDQEGAESSGGALVEPEAIDQETGPVRRSEALRRYSDARPTVLAGFVVIALTFGGFGTWAAIAPLARGAHVVGKIAVDSNRKDVQHLEGGIISEILVREGDRVEKSQVLIRLDETQVRAQLEIQRNRLIEELVRADRLVAERDGLDEIGLSPRVNALISDLRLASALADQRAIFAARRTEVENQIDILEDRIEQLRHQIGGLEAQQTSNRRQLVLMNEELAGLKSLMEKGFVPVNRVRALERGVAELEGEHAARISEMARLRVAIGETRLEIVRTKQSFRRDVLDQLREVRASINDLDEQITAAQDKLTRIEIQSPQTGQVVGLSVHTIGGVISPGQTVLSIVPENDRLIVEAQVRPVDADVVKPGLEAWVRVTSLPRRSAPLLKSTVLTVSSDTLTDPGTKRSYYLARLGVEDDELERLDDARLVPGMPVQVLIQAGERTALQYLVAPWTDLFSRAMRED